MDSLNELLQDQLKDLYSAEKQLTKALPRMAKKASTPSLKDAFTSHLRETEGQVQRLDSVGQSLGMRLTGKTCKAMQGLIEEGKEIIAEDGEPLVIDAGLIAAAQRVEHYEISAYGSARALAQKLDLGDVIQMLQQTLDEASAADQKLTEISVKEVLAKADAGGDEEEDENDEEDEEEGDEDEEEEDEGDEEDSEEDGDEEEDDEEDEDVDEDEEEGEEEDEGEEQPAPPQKRAPARATAKTAPAKKSSGRR